ncbi:hypothetical protein H8S90_14635 [Olivibacter sp. SDN3]|uniref:hypothetical protein n=1 Tax=Olivibacter sp. SDN3 TaxID=2764720 RepID=UPI0016519289|nr:hypothetical protein [Olivibacter sp. SDN3]QNL48042.1 hypothetical protein H8S90_14635 [Olivibacter sp. SDN3]
MNITKRVIAACCLFNLLILACKKDDLNSNRLYRGEVVAKYCPSTAIVRVTNANIGGTRTINQQEYPNIIGISNCPDEINTGSSISFYLDVSGDFTTCQAVVPCLQVAPMPQPIDTYCSRDLMKTN